MKRVLTRRQYLAGTAAGLAAAALQAQPPKQPSTALPRRVLGRTGVSVPILGFGSGSRFTNFYTDDAGEAAVRQAIDCGITYLDTAAGYGNGRSETIYGRVLKTRRSEVFLATKTRCATPTRLCGCSSRASSVQTDHVDILQYPQPRQRRGPKSRPKAACSRCSTNCASKGGPLPRHDGARQSVSDQARHRAARPDCVQMALNAALVGMVKCEGGYKPDPSAPRSFETVTLPAARKKNLGILAMKVFGQGHLVGEGADKVGAEQLLRYALSMPITVAVVGMQDPAMIPQNAAWARAFTPMTEDEMKALSGRLAAANKVSLDRFLAHHEDVC